jgi:hypothetical protein
MKQLAKLFLIVLLFQSFQCDEDDTAPITSEILNEKKNQIKQYIASFPCEESVGCNSIAFGSKPCGGPWEYLIFSNAVNLTFLENEVELYNEMEHQFNSNTGAISDCAIVSPPLEIGCVDGVCGIIE